MSEGTTTPTWPLRGLFHFIQHPKLWLTPIVTTIAGWIILAALAVLVIRLTWPDNVNNQWWEDILGALLAFGWAALTMLIGWMLAIPVLIGLAYEDLVRKVLLSQNVELGEEATIAAMKSSIQVLIRNLGWVILWPVLSLACNFIPLLAPIGVLISQIGIAHVTALEACDLALSSRGVTGRERIRMMKARRGKIISAALVGGVLSLLLGITFIGWLLFLPAMFTGAALLIARWDLPTAALEGSANQQTTESADPASQLPASAEG